MINFERLDAAITYAAEHPAEFNMGEWFERLPGCGTTACLAGTAAVQAGWKPVWGADVDAAVDVQRDGVSRDVWSVASELLGFTAVQETVYYAEDLAHVIEIRNAWAREAGIPERTWGAS